MNDYSTWSEKRISVQTLQLDPSNPRIPDIPEGVSQRELIADLVRHEDVAGLAKDIIDQGYSPLEMMLGYEEDDGNTYILEGNRRLAALKILHNPEAAPEEFKKRFRALSAKADGRAPTKARVILAPTRDDAAGLIMQKHTRTQVASWEPVMQARFFKNLMRKGKTVDDLARRYGFTPGFIRDRLRTLSMYEAACAVPLPPEVREKVHNPREFKISAIERLTDMPNVREFLGIDFDADGGLRGRVDRADFERAYARIISDYVAGKLDTRTVNTTKAADRYLTKIDDVRPRRKGKFGSGDFEDEASKRAAGGPSPASTAKPRPAPRESSTLIPKRRKCPVSDRRVRDVWEELQQLRVDDVPNAAAVLVRILLELGVVRYLKMTGKDQPILEAERKKNPKRKAEWYPSLRQLLNPMINDPDIKVHPLVLKRVRQLVEQEKGPLSLDSLDGFVHNLYAFPSARELRGLWSMIDEVLQFVLVERLRPAASPAAAAGK